MPCFKATSVLRSTQLPNHAPCLLTLDLTVFSSKIWVLKPHPKWNLPDKPRTQQAWDVREELCYPIFLKYARKLVEASEALNVEAVWHLACSIATDMINLVCSSSLPPTRGSPLEFRQIVFSRPSSCDRFHKRVRKVASLLVELKKKATAGIEGRSQAWEANLHSTAANCTRAAANAGVEVVIDCSSSSSLLTSCTQAEAFLFSSVDRYDAQSKQQALHNWKLKLRKSSSSCKRHVHRWLKGERTGPPRLFQKPDGSFTADMNEMLGMISDYMGSIYIFHQDACPNEMEQHFYEKYRATVDSMASEASVPPICHHDLFRLFQDKSPDKASGLDGWKVAELHQLPPCGWIGFAFTMRLAEATHVWPKALKVVAISSISKGLSMTSPENVRCIGVAPLIYSLWSSLRFKHLREWQSAICPPSLVGGLSGRSADVSEWEFSLDVLGAGGESRWTSILLDRFKCFDLLLPKVGFGVAVRLGMPPHIANAALNFYENQYKFFKLGSAFGDRVLYSNSAVQGCSMSILIVNTLYSVFANHLVVTAPIVEFRSFIDDAKFWAPSCEEAQLERAFQEAEAFDRSIGQTTNDLKTAILSKRMRDSSRFLRQVGRSFKQVKWAKSLGYSRNLHKQNRPALQNQRVDKACQTLKRIANLPIPFHKRQTHIHANAHSQWLHGTDVQAPSSRKLMSLRSAVLGCLFSKQNRMRSPYLFFATHEDVFLDSFCQMGFACLQ